MRIRTESLYGTIKFYDEDDGDLSIRYEDPEWPEWWCEIHIDRKRERRCLLKGTYFDWKDIKCNVVKMSATQTKYEFRFKDVRMDPPLMVDFIITTSK